MERPIKINEYKKLSDEDLRKLCVQHGLYSDKRKMLARETYVNALNARTRRALPYPKHNYPLNYKAFAVADLRQFCEQRGIYAEDRREMAHSTYVAALRLQDREATFRFLDLPPEIRGLVYAGLLNHQYGENYETKRVLASKAYPQILRVSKLCYKEARDLLYQQSSLTLSFRMFDLLCVTGDIEVSLLPKVEHMYRLDRQVMKFAKLQNINVLLRVENFEDDERELRATGWGLWAILEAIVATFDEQNALKLLRVKYVCTSGSSDDEAMRHAWDAALPQRREEFEKGLRASSPLSDLPSSTRVELVGFECLNSRTLEALTQKLINLNA